MIRDLPLPGAFEFYETGLVEPLDAGLESPKRPLMRLEAQGLCGFAYRILSDPPQWLLLLHPEGLDESLYAELGNVLASRQADRRAALDGDRVTLSPPQRLGQPAIARLLASYVEVPGAKVSQWVHRSRGGAVPLTILSLPSETEVMHDA